MTEIPHPITTFSNLTQLENYLDADQDRSDRMREKSRRVLEYTGPKLYGPSMLFELADQSIDKFSTGIPEFDLRFGGLDYGRVAIIAARPSHGKSALALDIALRVARRQKGWVLYFSAELSAHEIARRMKRRGDLGATDRILIVEDEAPTTKSMRGVLEHIAGTREDGVSLAIFDYLDYSGERHDNETLRLGKALQGCHILAKEHHIPFVVVQQLNRSIEGRSDPRPRLSDLRWSGAAEQIASVVIMLQHKLVQLEQSGDADSLRISGKPLPEDWELDLYVRKNTHGKIGAMPMQFDMATGRMYDKTESPLLQQAGI